MGKFKNTAVAGKTDSTEEVDVQVSAASVEDASPVVIEASNAADAAAQLVDGIIQDIAAEEEKPDPRTRRQNRRYRVTGGPSSVMYNGQRIGVTLGKIFVEHSVDLDHLRRQGVQLQLEPDITSITGANT